MSIKFSLSGIAVSWDRNFSTKFDGITIDLDGDRNMLPIRGITGVGKTTLLYVLAGVKWPDAGVVEWRIPRDDGKFDVVGWGPDAKGPDARTKPHQIGEVRRRYFSMSFQDGRLLPYLTVAQNLSYPLTIRGHNQIKADKLVRDRIAPFLTQTEMSRKNDRSNGKATTDILDQYPETLSGGQKRRMALAKAVIWDPSVLFADEPTGNLDPVTRKTVIEAIRLWGMSQGKNRAIIWVTHLDEDEATAGARRRLRVLDAPNTQTRGRRDETWVCEDLR